MLENIFANASTLLAIGLIAAVLFFAMVGIRELKDNQMQGFLFIVLSIFFACIHLFYLFNLPPDSFMAKPFANFGFWGWLAVLFSTALIGLYLAIGLFNFITSQVRSAALKIFFGLTLICYLYMIGGNWPVDVKGILTIIWGWLWFEIELKTAV